MYMLWNVMNLEISTVYFFFRKENLPVAIQWKYICTMWIEILSIEKFYRTVKTFNDTKMKTDSLPMTKLQNLFHTVVENYQDLDGPHTPTQEGKLGFLLKDL